ncbi:hypothetical protein GQ457_12G015900 [Hibiscus cannabinus]
MFAASFGSKMECLYSVFNVKKQGKPVWVVRTRNWKLQGVENRLSGLLEGVSIVSSGRQGSKKDRQWGGYALLEELRFWHVAAQISAYLVSSIGTLTEYRYPNSTLEFGYRYQLGRVSVPLVSIPAIRVSVPREGYRYPSPLWDLSIDTGIRVPIPAAWKLFL